jgi:hypothetical protein
LESPAVEADPVAVRNPYSLSAEEIASISEQFHGRFGSVVFDCGPLTATAQQHPLVAMGEQLRRAMPCRWPIANAAEAPDGTAKIFDVGRNGTTPNSNRLLAPHQDGLQLGGAIAVAGLWTDSAPQRAAATYVQNMLPLIVDLWRTDLEAFDTLSRRDAITITRRRDKAQTVSPIVFVRDSRPRVLFRAPGEEYDVHPSSRHRNSPAARAFEFLVEYTRFGARGSTFTYFDRPGRGIFMNNHICVHGRTAYADGGNPNETRVLAGKWWALEEKYNQLPWR